jgi:hypothetical protein
MVAAVVRYLFRSAVVIVFALGTLASSACVMVKAHQRGHLAKRAMTNDLETGEARFAGHERGSREGAEGGTGEPGGGCGCN